MRRQLYEITLYTEQKYNAETGLYEDTDRYVLDDHRLLGEAYQVVNKESTAYVAGYRYTAFRTFKSFKNDFLPWVAVDSDETVKGINAMLKKLQIATEWYTDRWGLKAFTLRKEVRQRQNNINSFLNNDVVIYDLK